MKQDFTPDCFANSEVDALKKYSPASQNWLLILTHGGMGDLLISSVLAEGLHHCYPGCQVSLWGRPDFTPLFGSHPYVDSCLAMNPAASLLDNARLLRQHQFDGVLIPWSVSRHAWLTALAGIPIRVGQGGRLTYSFLFTHPVKVRSVYGDTTSHWSDIQLDYLRVLDCEPPKELRPRVIVNETEKEKAQALLLAKAVPASQKICGLHVCKGLAVNPERWPLQRFVDIAVQLVEQGFSVVLTGTAQERPLTASVAEDALARLNWVAGSSGNNPCPIVDFAGLGGIRETAALIQQMNVFICPDTGTGHLAAALDVPVVSIFPLRSDYPDRWRPCGEIHRVIRPAGWDCSGPCVKEQCPYFSCLLQIDPTEVVAAALEITR